MPPARTLVLSNSLNKAGKFFAIQKLFIKRRINLFQRQMRHLDELKPRFGGDG